MGTQQSYAGVNLNQEAANMVQFQQAYQASAQVISTAEQIFSSLITAIQQG
jgi:flagellar hook-associated protein 1 FlgK